MMQQQLNQIKRLLKLSMATTRRQISSWVSEQRALPYRLRKSIVKRIDPSLFKDHSFTMDFFGLKYQGNTSNNIDCVTYFCGAYEKYMLFFLRDMVKKLQRDDLVFWDIGANVGNHSLFMAQYVKEVHAFEPYEVVRNRLKNNLAINSINNITVHAYGIGNKNETLPFYAPPEFSQGNGSFVENCNPGNEYYNELDVRVGDDVIAQGIPAPDVIKIDAEGFERNVLEGLKQTLETQQPLVIFEMSDATHQAFGNVETMQQALPKNYHFLRFSKGNRDKGDYQLAPFDFNTLYKRRDVVACPDEMMKYIISVTV